MGLQCSHCRLLALRLHPALMAMWMELGFGETIALGSVNKGGRHAAPLPPRNVHRLHEHLPALLRMDLFLWSVRPVEVHPFFCIAAPRVQDVSTGNKLLSFRSKSPISQPIPRASIGE